MSVLPLMSASGLPGKRVEAYRAGMIAIALFIGFVLLLLFVWFCCLVVPCYSHAKGGCFYFGEGEMAMGRASVMVGSFAIIASSALYFFVVWFYLQGFMYLGGVTFSINKSFGNLQLVPEPNGLRICYTPVVNGAESSGGPGFLDLIVPLDAIGGLWATARAFLYGVESLDENVILQGGATEGDSDILIKLYRDKPRGAQGKLAGDEVCWLRLVTGRTEEERRRIKLGPRDLLSLELACNAVMVIATQAGNIQPKLVR